MYLKKLLFLVFVLFVACKEKKQSDGGQKRTTGPITAEAFLVAESSISNNIEVPGTILPFEETQIRSEISGRVVELNIVEGAMVSKGTLLVKLFDKDLQAQLRKLKVQLQIKEKTEERNRELVKINGISQQDYDLVALDLENLRADMEAVQIALSKTEVRAPYTGKLGLRNISLGAYVSPTDIVTTISQVDKLKLEFSVPEKYAKELVKDYAVKFRVDGGTGIHMAKVAATENSVDENTRTLRVRSLITNKSKELVPGAFAKVNIMLGQDDKALLVPTQALIPTARNKQVIVLQRDSAVYTVVETGLRDSAYIQVTKGLNVGDTVLTSGLMAIRPNSKVRVSKLGILKRGEK